MGKRIVVIDDDKEICELVELFLKLEGFDVVTANTGIQGLDIIRCNHIDLVILDIGLPDVNGQQICRIIRSETNVPIIILSARDSVLDKVIGLDYGADDYVSKPFENMELLARINAIMRRVERTENATGDEFYPFHHITINIGKRQAYIGELPLKLTPKEYELLVYFSKNAGLLLSRDRIIEDLWGNDTLYRWSRSLDVHIQNLRQKIEINPKNPELIKTVSGTGYKIKGA
ncbi:MAG: response regulator transcription factor [Deferribacteraceae bacterium]|jgi:two-component system alkaline phosphatase synthesis response regulator PhoP|nr:response regulator transcription factor [Deferribacteraceae bacterium]